jgi:hypothetical protein
MREMRGEVYKKWAMREPRATDDEKEKEKRKCSLFITDRGI